MPNQKKIDSHFMRIAWVTALTMSKDPSTKVGAVIVSSDTKKISVGYNGFATGIEETPDKWQRPLKYQFVVHAEENALLNCPFDKSGCTLYCTHQPCHKCISRIRNAGIIRVVYYQKYDNLECIDIWNEHAKLFNSVESMEKDDFIENMKISSQKL